MQKLKHKLSFKRTWVQLPSPIRHLTIICNSSSWASDVFLHGHRAHAWNTGMHKRKTFTHSQSNNIDPNSARQWIDDNNIKPGEWVNQSHENDCGDSHGENKCENVSRMEENIEAIKTCKKKKKINEFDQTSQELWNMSNCPNLRIHEILWQKVSTQEKKNDNSKKKLFNL